jgi:hypothetical protein
MSTGAYGTNRVKEIEITFKGRTLTVNDWGRILGINRNTILTRHRSGLPVEDVLYPGNLAKRNRERAKHLA